MYLLTNNRYYIYIKLNLLKNNIYNIDNLLFNLLFLKFLNYIML